MRTKICIIEDDRTIAAMYQFKLESRGYEVRVAYDGRDGLALINNFAPEIVLLDLSMPVMSGEVMLEKLRATSWGGNIRVIILTNISKAEAPQKLRFLNVDRYVVKAHHTPTQVANIVAEVLAT
jgi:DNA-binding response OmpR family regulator